MKDFLLVLAAVTTTMIGGYVIGRAEIAETHANSQDRDQIHQAFLNGMDAEAEHTPIRLVGYGCEGAGHSGVMWAAEEDDFPKCEEIRPVGQRL